MELQYQTPQKLLIADCTAILRRVYDALKHSEKPSDSPLDAAEVLRREVARVEGALDSSMKSLIRSLREHEPTHFLAAFDHPGPTFRHRISADYKSNREPKTPAFAGAGATFQQRLNESGLRAISVPDVESDDTIATLATRAVARGFDVVVLFFDKDHYPLLECGVKLYDHFEGKWRDAAGVVERFGVRPGQMTDFLALMGDSVDNIPGVNKCGVKTAAKLLQEHGDLDAILQAAHSMKGQVGDELRKNPDAALMSRRLTALKLDVELGLKPRDLALSAGILSYIHTMPEPRLVRTSPRASEAEAWNSRNRTSTPSTGTAVVAPSPTEHRPRHRM